MYLLCSIFTDTAFLLSGAEMWSMIPCMTQASVTPVDLKVMARVTLDPFQFFCALDFIYNKKTNTLTNTSTLCPIVPCATQASVTSDILRVRLACASIPAWRWITGLCKFQIKSYQNKSNQIKPNQIKSKQIKSNQQYSNSNISFQS